MLIEALDIMEKYPVRKIEGHECSLPTRIDTECDMINQGWCIPLRRKLQKMLMLARKHPQAKAHLKSTYLIKIEEVNHLKKHPMIVHPFSWLRFGWETFMLPVYYYNFLLIPIIRMLQGRLRSTFFLVGSSIVYVDIFFTFICGYFDEDRQVIVMSPWLIFKRYIKGFFFIDVISFLPWNTILIKSGMIEGPHIICSVITSFRIVRVKTCREYLGKLQKFMGFSSFFYKLISTMAILILLLEWSTWADFVILKLTTHKDVPDSELLDVNIHMFYSNLGKLCLISTDELTISVQSLAHSVMVVSVGLWFQIFLLLQIKFLNRQFNSGWKNFQTLKRQFQEYMSYKKLSKVLCERINNFITFRFHNTAINERAVLSNFSNMLKQDLMIHSCNELVRKVGFFQEMPQYLLVKIVSLMKTEIFLPNDVIIRADIVGYDMYFIYVGTVAIYSKSGKEICHLTDGSHFGEIALLFNETRTASVVAVDFCELYKLTKKDFEAALELYPLLKDQIMSMARERYNHTLHMEMEDGFER